MKKPSKYALFLKCLFFLSMGLNAQVTSSLDSTYLDMSFEELLQVKVKSASFFESDALTVGSSVSVIEREDWERKGVRRTLDAIAQEPSVMLYPSLYGQSVIAIRGYGGISSARGIATLVDGIPMNGPFLGSGQYLAQNINLGVLDRVEVIRGPGSALYGTDAFHGVLSMTTFESEEDLTRVAVEGGIDHYYQASLQESVGLGDYGRLDFALGVSGEEFAHSYKALDLKRLTGRKINSTDRYRSQTGSLKLTLNPTPQLKIKGGFLVDNFEADNYPANFYTVDESDLTSTTLAGQLSAIYSFANNQTLEARIHHMRNQSPASRVGVFYNFGLAQLETNMKENRTGTTLTFRHPETEKWRTEYAISLGFEQLFLKDGWTNYSPLDPPSSPTRTDVGAKGEHRDITHLVLDAQTSLGDHWSVLYGGRVDHYSDMDTQLSPRLGLVFQPVEHTAIKLLYQRAFRAPTLAERYSIPPTIVVFDLDPEILNSYELVILKKFASWKGEVVLFQNDWDDGILFALDSSSPVGYVYENSGNNQARGVEASLGWYPKPWRIDLSGSYVQSTNLNTDKEYQLFPSIMMNAGVGRKFEGLGIDIYLNNRFFNGAQDVDSGASLLGDPEDLPVYWRTDLNMTKKFSSGMDLTVNIINLFDRDNRVPSVLGFSGGVEDYSLCISAGVRYAF